jgi:hypothetical protein
MRAEFDPAIHLLQLAAERERRHGSYVQNNPLKSTDPTGHCTVDGEAPGWLWCKGHSLGFTETKKETAAREENEAEVREFLREHPEYLRNAMLMAVTLGTAMAIEAGGMGSGADGDSTVTTRQITEFSAKEIQDASTESIEHGNDVRREGIRSWRGCHQATFPDDAVVETRPRRFV